MTPHALCLALVLAPGPAAAPQAPAGQPPAPPAAAQPAPPAQPSAVDPVYTYDPEGRRDPFLSLLGRGRDPKTSTPRPAGLPGLLIADVTVKGIIRDRGGFIAMIQSPDGKTYTVRTGDRLFDGSVKAIVADKVIFSQDVNDPLSPVKQREVPKAVRPADGRGADHAP
ncbi:MAG TPA: hypothetical protein VLD67_11940 [Vicinamibacterales bacterium]|nr:hypothetical protein [Vicinamibacterales bacterium]